MSAHAMGLPMWLDNKGAAEGDLRRAVHTRLLGQAGLNERLDREEVFAAVSSEAPLLPVSGTNRLIAEVLADIHGLGRLQPFLEDDAVTDVMVVGDKGVWVERCGEVTKTALCLEATEIERLIERVISPLGLRVDRASPMADARLPDGSRVNAIIPPLAIDGPCLTIRRFGARSLRLDELTTPVVCELLDLAVRTHQNILISGGTGAGKTTLLNALAARIESSERIITVEDAAELRIPIPHVVRLESRQPNSENVGAVSVRELVRNALRMRPDRIIVGEVRGSEALDMLQAMNTGHEGSMSTCHANSPSDALRRIETMVLMGDVAIPLDAVRQQIVGSIDVVVQIARITEGKRQVIDVSEVSDRDGIPTVNRIATGSEVVAAPSRPPRRSAAQAT